MQILLISYDLNGHERPSAYEAVAEVIETNAQDSQRPLYSQWLVLTALSQGEWFDLLEPVLDANDSVLIVPVRYVELVARVDSGIIAWLQRHG